MPPDSDLLLVNAYIDGEMDLRQQLEFEERLRREPALRACAEDIKRLNCSLREDADYHVLPAHEVAALVPHAPLQAGRHATRGRDVREGLAPWFAWRPLVPALALAAAITVGLNLSLAHLAADRRLKDELVASHVRAALSDRLVDVVSSDQHTVKPWLSSRLDFSPPVRALGLPGSEFVGGRVDYLGGRRVAVLVYKQGGHLVDHYIWPADAADRAPHTSMVKGFRVAEWTQGGMSHRLVTDATEPELEAIIKDCRATAALS